MVAHKHNAKVVKIRFDKYYKPKPKQEFAHRQIAKYLLFGGALGGGKSYFLCAEGITHCLRYPGARAVIVRKERTVIMETIWVTFHKVCPKEIIGHVDNKSLTVTFINGSTLRFMQADRAKDPMLNKIKGLEISWFGIDEANEVDEMVFTMLKTRLRWVLPGMPDNQKLYPKGNVPRYEGRLTSNPENCWLIPWFIESDDPHHMYVESLTTDNYDEKDEYYQILLQAFKNDPELKQKYLFARWDLVDKINQLIAGESIKKAFDFIDNGFGTGLGVDPARFGKDKTTFTYIDKGNIEDIEGFSGWSIDKTVDHTMKLIDKYELSPECVGVDGVGLGAGVVDYLHKYGYMVQDLIGGARVDPERIEIGVFKPYNLRSQMAWSLRQDVLHNRLGGIQDATLIRQLGWLEYDIAGDKTMRVASKEAIMKIHMKSPDYSDSTMYANWCKVNRDKTGLLLPMMGGNG